MSSPSSLYIITWLQIKDIYICVADSNECAQDLDNCHQNADCINSVGSFSCVCKPGYTGDGVTCTAIQQEDPCGKIAVLE